METCNGIEFTELCTLNVNINHYKNGVNYDYAAVQIVVLKYLVKAQGKAILETKQWLQVIIFVQYIFRFGRFYPLTSDLKKTAGGFAESAWLGAAYYLLWYLLSSHVSMLFNAIL